MARSCRADSRQGVRVVEHMRTPSVFIRLNVRTVVSAVLCVVALAAATGTLGVPGPKRSQSEARAADLGGVVVTEIVVPGEDGQAVRLRGGVPFARSAHVRDPGRLVLARRVAPDTLDAGEIGKAAKGDAVWERVSAEWRVAARWDGRRHDEERAIRWAHVDALARGGETLAVIHTRPPVPDDAPSTAVRIASVSERGVHVDTGRLRFTVRRDMFAPLADFARRDSNSDAATYVDGPLTGGGDVLLRFATLVGRDGVEEWSARLSQSSPDTVELEASGPVRASIVVRGRVPGHASAGSEEGCADLRYTLRIEVWKGGDDVRFDFSLTNLATGAPAYLRDVRLEIPTDMLSGVSVQTSDGEFSAARGVRLLQRHDVVARADETRNFSYTLTSWGTERPGSPDVRVLATGARSDGVLALSTDARSFAPSVVVAVVDEFWQRWPGAISFANGTLAFEFLPQAPGLRWPPDLGDLPHRLGDAYRLDAGRRASWRCSIALPAATPPTARLADAFLARAPVIPSVSADRVARSGAAGPIAPSEFDLADPPLQALLRRHAHMQRALVDAEHAESQGPGAVLPPVSIATQRESRASADPAHRYDADLYGWLDHGDLIDARGYGAGREDWLRGLLLAHLRHAPEEDGESPFLVEAQAMLQHRLDAEQQHVTGGSQRERAAFARSSSRDPGGVGGHGRWNARANPDREAPRAPLATRLRGLLLAHAITAEPRALEAARWNAAAFMRYAEQEVAAFARPQTTQARRPPVFDVESWSVAIDELLAFHEYTGDERARAAALALFEDCVLRAEELRGGEGVAVGGNDTARVVPLVRLLQSVVAVHEQTGDPRALGLLLRSVRTLRHTGFADSGVRDGASYVPLQLSVVTSVRDVPGERRSTFIPFGDRISGVLAHVADATDDAELMSLAVRVFRDTVLFHDAPSGDARVDGMRSVASFAPRQYAGMEVTTGAWLLQSHERLLAHLFRTAGGASSDAWSSDPFFVRTLSELARADRAYVAAVVGGTGDADALAPRVSVVEFALMDRELVLRIHASAPVYLSARIQRADGSGSVWSARVAPQSARGATVHDIVFDRVVADMDYDVFVTARDLHGRVQVLGPLPLRPSVAAADPVDPTGFELRGSKSDSPGAGSIAADRVVLDDRDAVLSGAWRRRDSIDAYGGQQIVAGGPDALATATFVQRVDVAGAFRLFMRWDAVPNAAPRAHIEIRDADGVTWVRVDQSTVKRRWRLLGTVRIAAGGQLVVRVSNAGAGGAVAVDALRLDRAGPR